jgi:hypothetical protein
MMTMTMIIIIALYAPWTVITEALQYCILYVYGLFQEYKCKYPA